jgi:nitroreductase
MREEELTAEGWAVGGRDSVGYLLIWALRRLVLWHEQPCPAVGRAFADICPEPRDDALATFRAFISILCHTARDRIRIGRPSWPKFTSDEKRLLALIRAAQEDDQPGFDALLSRFALHELRHELATGARAVAMTLATHNLWLAPSPSVSTRSTGSAFDALLSKEPILVADNLQTPAYEKDEFPALQCHFESLAVLLSRRSTSSLRDPAPNDEELGAILEAGLRAPDHGRLRPWRFVLIRNGARAVFAELLVEALQRRDPAASAAMLDRIRKRLFGVPLVIAVGATIRPGSPIPEIEQLLSAGAAAMNILNAVHALGYGGIWVTGANSYDRSLNEALGFTWPDRLVGLLYVGTPEGFGTPFPRPSRAEHVREWVGPSLNQG